MFTLKNDSTEIIVNELGAVDSWSDNILISSSSPLYPVIFKDYSRLDSACRLFDSSEKIEIKSRTEKSVEFSKKYENLVLWIRISLTDNGFDWNLNVCEPNPLHMRFGVTGPVSKSDDFVSYQGNPVNDISVYFRSFHEVFRDQTHLTMPILYAKSDNILIFSSMDKNIQFFKYKQDGTFYIRSTGSTSLSNHLCLSIRHVKQLDIEQTVLLTYPSYDYVLNKWRQTIEKIEAATGVPVILPVSAEKCNLFLTNVEYEEATKTGIEETANILLNEVERYPQNFLKQIGIDSFFLCANIKYTDLHENRAFVAIALSHTASDKTKKTLLIDANKCTPHILHHEIFHFIEKKCDFSQWPRGEYYLLPNSHNNDSEFRCELFATMMSSQQKLSSLISKSFKMGEQLQYLILAIRSKFPNFEFYDDLRPITETRKLYCLHNDESQSVITFGHIPQDRSIRKFFVGVYHFPKEFEECVY